MKDVTDTQGRNAPAGIPTAAIWRLEDTYIPFLVAAGMLLLLLLVGQKFWLTNDDIRMAMTVGGYGIAAAPSPGLVIDNSVVWGWLLMHVPDVAGIRGYTIATYTLLLFSLIAIFTAVRRLRAPPFLAAAVLLCMYGGVVLYPQFTLLSGYLAAAGFALVLASDGGNLRRSMAAAGPLLLLSGLIRPDEMALVFIVACPFLLYAWRAHPDTRWRLHWLGLAVACAALLAGAFLYTQHYSSTGAWTEFHDIDGPRGEFTDYHLGSYFLAHQDQLAGGPISANDIKLLYSFFYVDPAVFNSRNVDPLINSVTLTDRYALNSDRSELFFSVFMDHELQLMLALFLVFAVLNWRRPAPEAASLLLLLALMLAIGLWGRPGVLRIYVPAAAAMMTLALLKLGPRRGPPTLILGVVALLSALGLCGEFQLHARSDAIYANHARAIVCASVPKDQLLVVWTGGGIFDWKDIYRPTTRDDDACNPPLYAIGTYQLAPPSLARLHAYTGGLDFIDALLAGHVFHITTSEARLKMLDRYLQEHYRASLHWTEVKEESRLEIYTIQASPVGTP
ncbi:MAG TPA: hypothetical protein VH327_02180 [Gammaproteobacteria bacterium]|jgi:hypothetical protein|nr:hypothetical protein [Gammaproteobacteria bacterium]